MELQLDLALSGGSDPIQVVVGWPPVKSWRRNTRRIYATNGGGRGPKSMYVKVNMEGFGITRKIDLTIHRSFRTLAPTLISLFGRSGKENVDYKLMYQNKEGEWVHARDVPWECFMESVQRLKLLKNAYSL